MSQVRRRPRQHTVHTQDPRYNVSNYDRGHGDRIAQVAPESSKPDRWDRQYAKIEALKKLITKKEHEIEELEIRIGKEEVKLDAIREANAPKRWLKLIKAERVDRFGWVAEVETETGEHIKIGISPKNIRGGKHFDGEWMKDAFTYSKPPSHTGGKIRVNESTIQAALDWKRDHPT